MQLLYQDSMVYGVHIQDEQVLALFNVGPYSLISVLLVAHMCYTIEVMFFKICLHRHIIINADCF